MPEATAIPAPVEQPKVEPKVENLLPEKEAEKKQRLHVQPKLTVGAPDDPYEKEADAVADKVMRKTNKETVQKKCETCQQEEMVRRSPQTPIIQRTLAVSNSNPPNMPANDVAGTIPFADKITHFTTVINALCPAFTVNSSGGVVPVANPAPTPATLSSGSKPVGCCGLNVLIASANNWEIRTSQLQGPHTDPGNFLFVLPPANSDITFGHFTAGGTRADMNDAVVAGHEMIGHGAQIELGIHNQGNEDRESFDHHDPTVRIQNVLALEQGFSPTDARGLARSGVHRGESFGKVDIKEFDFNSSDVNLLPPTEFSKLQLIADFILENEMWVDVTGHSDPVGSTFAKQFVSDQRARAVQQKLISLGVTQFFSKSLPTYQYTARRRYTQVRGVSDSQPPAVGAADHANWRRVEVFVTNHPAGAAVPPRDIPSLSAATPGANLGAAQSSADPCHQLIANTAFPTPATSTSVPPPATTTAPLPVLPKLEVDNENSPLEREADDVADKVMRMPAENFIQRKCADCEQEEKLQRKSDYALPAGSNKHRAAEPNFIQRKCAECEQEEKLQRKEEGGLTLRSARHTEPNFIQKKCEACEHEDNEQVHRKPISQTISTFVQAKADNTPAVSDSLASSIQGSRGSGSSMNGETQTFMEDRFGSSFKNVKLHTDSQSAQMNQELGAKAFTVGSDIYFNQGQYQPGSDSGKQLLAHELTHVVQQGGGEEQISREPKVSVDESQVQITTILGTKASSTENLDFLKKADPEATKLLIIAGGKLNVYDTANKLLGSYQLKDTVSLPSWYYFVEGWLFYPMVANQDNELGGVSKKTPVTEEDKKLQADLDKAFDLETWFNTAEDKAAFDKLVGTSVVALAVAPISTSTGGSSGDGVVLTTEYPDWLKELKTLVEGKIAAEKAANKDNMYVPDRLYVYGSDKVQMQKGPDAWTFEVEKEGINAEAYYTVLKKQWDDASDKDVFANEVVKVLYEKVQQLYKFTPGQENKEVWEIDGRGGDAKQNKFDDEGSKPKSNPFSGLKQEEIDKLKALFKQIVGDAQPDKDAPPPKIKLTQNDIKALLSLADDPQRDQIVEYLKAKTGGGVTSDKSMEDLIAAIRVSEAAKRMGLETDKDAKREPPIVSRPVQGNIVQHDPLIVVDKTVSFGFEVRNDVDALRVPWVRINWIAYTDPKKNDANSLAPKDWKKTDWNRYMTINDEGPLNSKHFKLEFPAEGIYTIEAIVDHNFFLPNLFRTSIKVLDEKKVLKEKEDKAYKGMTTDGDTTTTDFGQIKYGEGTVTKGKLDPKFKGATAAEQLAAINEEITRMEKVIADYKEKGGADGEAMVAWGEKYVEKLKANRDRIKTTSEDVNQNIVAARGTYVSRTLGVKTADLKLTCFVKKDTRYIAGSGEFDPGTTEEGYTVTLYDYTQLYENENYSIDKFATTSEEAMKQVFSELSEAYPNGHISVAFQKWNDSTNAKTDEYLKYTRVTDTVGKKVKGVLFSTPVNIAVNVIAIVLTIFPPTAAGGLALGILYNGAQTVSELQEQAAKGTLTGKSVTIGVGSMLLDILPILGSAGKAAKIVRVGSKAFYVIEGIELGAQGLLMYETGMDQVEKLRTDYFVKIAEIDDQIRELQRTNPSDPAIDDLTKQKEKLMTDGHAATEKVFREMIAQQLVFTVGAKVLHGVHDSISTKNKLEARGKIETELGRVGALNEGERIALADKIFDADVTVKQTKDTTGWRKEGDKWVLDVGDNATHAEVDALLNKNPNTPPSTAAPTTKPKADETEPKKGTEGDEKKNNEQPKTEAKDEVTSPIDADGDSFKTPTNETHEHRVHQDGTITRCSDRCTKLVDNTTSRADTIERIFGKKNENTKKSRELQTRAEALQNEAKEAVKIEDAGERKIKEDAILEKAKQLEIEMATLEKAMLVEVQDRIAKSQQNIDAFLAKYPEYKGVFEQRMKNRQTAMQELTPKLNDPDPAIKQQAWDALERENRLMKELAVDMQKHADNMTKPNISERYKYYESTNSEGEYVKVAEGELGVPGEVMKHRDTTEQAKVGEGKGDDAGHLIGNIFGAAGDERNLGKQNWIANEFGTWRQLEIMWAQKLLNGTKIKVVVREVSVVKGERPYMREAIWTEVGPNGETTNHRMRFGNFESKKTREKSGTAPTADVPAGGGTVFIWNEERKKRGLAPVFTPEELQKVLSHLDTESKTEKGVFEAANDNVEE